MFCRVYISITVALYDFVITLMNSLIRTCSIIPGIFKPIMKFTCETALDRL